MGINELMNDMCVGVARQVFESHLLFTEVVPREYDNVTFYHCIAENKIGYSMFLGVEHEGEVFFITHKLGKLNNLVDAIKLRNGEVIIKALKKDMENIIILN